jgi:LmbE family N-acetylglucosaminyl deacetylase
MEAVYRAWLLVALVGVACGDVPLPRSHDLVIVAHQDDDLLFMQPDLRDIVHDHRPTTIVYVTAGDAGLGVGYATSRITATKAAYGWVAGSHDWACHWITVAGHAVQRCELPAAHLELLYLGYPDGGVVGDAPGSLLRLWEGAIDRADTVAEHVATYDRAGLVAALGEIIEIAQPTMIRTLEVAATHGADHSDHMLVGALALLAAARANTDAALLAYRGYNINYDPPNNPEAIYDEASLGMRAYAACQTGCASCDDSVCDTVSDPRYQGFLHRHYAVAMRRPPMSGRLQIASSCVIVDGDAVALGDCARGSELRFEPGGRIRAGARCLRLSPDNELVAGDCQPGPERYFLFDDEGHLWAGVPPPAGPAMATDHTMCLIDDGDRVRAAVCGAGLDRRWVLGRPPTTNARSELGITAHGRSVQLADVDGDGKADLCRIEGGGLWCAMGDGNGGFLGSTRIDALDQPLDIEPDSLMLGDLDGDGLLDACGRSARGILCAFAGNGYAADLWSPAFARTGPATPGDRSLAIVDGQVCGMIDGGVACASAAAPPAMRSSWPMRGATLWPADLDGDTAVDWCTATAAGPACGLAADLSVTSDGTPWGFAFHAAVEGSAATDGIVVDQVHGAVADVSGDGRADLCVIVGNNVECALSQGHAFGPRFPVLTLPATSTPEAMWLGDLDGDGKADPCVDDGTTIFCTVSH